MEKIYTIKEVCEYLKISERTFHRWVKNEKLKIIRLNGNVIRVKETSPITEKQNINDSMIGYDVLIF